MGDSQKKREVCLIFVYNHKYDQNIEKLERIYHGRFDNIFHLVPFYEGQQQNVIPVYDNSFRFQGYMAQSCKYIFNPKYSHYIFVADDLLLNPRLNAGNIIEELNLDDDSGYIKERAALSDQGFEWFHTLLALETFSKANGVEYQREIPDKAEAQRLFKVHGFSVRPFGWDKLRGWQGGYFNQRKKFLQSIAYLLDPRKDNLSSYPLAAGYSDFTVIPATSVKKFCKLCGVFAAMNLFVEVAIPTAMILSCKRVVTEKDIKWRGVEMWGENYNELMRRQRSLDFKFVLDSFGEDQLYLHPVKLSQWENINL